MSSSNQTLHNNNWPNLSFRKEELEEDSTENSEDEEDALVEEEDKVENQSNVIPMEYSGNVKGSALMHSAHIVHPTSIMLKISLN